MDRTDAWERAVQDAYDAFDAGYITQEQLMDELYGLGLKRSEVLDILAREAVEAA